MHGLCPSSSRTCEEHQIVCQDIHTWSKKFLIFTNLGNIDANKYQHKPYLTCKEQFVDQNLLFVLTFVSKEQVNDNTFWRLIIHFNFLMLSCIQGFWPSSQHKNTT